MIGRFYIMFVLLITRRFPFSSGQICKFYNLKADCRYRIDGISMVQIQATINQCNDPIDITFRLQCGNPKLDWKYTFVNSNELKSVPGFDTEIGLQVKQGFIKENFYMVEADFHVREQPNADFINEDIRLTIPDNCLTVNEGGKIAIGILVALIIVASIALVVILWVRWRRRNQSLHNSNALVTNVAPPGISEPPAVHFKNESGDLQITSSADGSNSERETTQINANGLHTSEHSGNSSSHERY